VGADPGDLVLDVLRRALVDALHDAVSEVLGDLTALASDPSFSATAFDGLVLQPASTVHPVLDVLRRFTGGAPPHDVSLRGWRTTNGADAAFGLAMVARSEAAVVALTMVPAQGPRLVLRAAGLAGTTVELKADAFRLAVTGTTPDAVEVAFTTDAPPDPRRLVAGSDLSLSLQRPQTARLGDGPSVDFGTVDVGARIWSDDKGALHRSARLGVARGQVALVPGFLDGVLPVRLVFPLDLDLSLDDGAGVVLSGSPSLSTRLSGTDQHWLDLVVGVVGGDAPALSIGFATTLSASLPGVPITVELDGLGFSFPLSLDLGSALLPDPAALAPHVPDGGQVTVDLPVIAGEGFLRRVDRDLVGGLSVRIPPMSATAFGVLSEPHDGVPLSFLVILGATFPPPGVQIGFGFAITGLGGLVGVNRRIDREALMRAVSDGSAAALLFPADPSSAADSVTRALPAVFPAARGSVVAGPMFQIGWGGRLVSLSVAVLVESSRQVRLTILGTITVALPDPEVPLVFLRATFAGLIDPAEPSVIFVASLNGSHIVGVALTGDLLLLTRGGSDPALVISAGGFHPAFPVPRGVPALQRLGMDLCPVPWMQMRCEAYFALTSNTLQMGARLELAAEVAGCGLRGYLQFDALVQYSPFHFVADVSGGIALRAFGHNLMGVHLGLHLEGPAPYLARGTGSIDLWLFEVSFDFELGWGSPAPELLGVGPADDLHAALVAPSAWRSRSTTGVPGLMLTEAARGRLGEGTVLDPYAVVSVRQDVVPLGLEIHRYRGAPVATQRWDLVDGSFGPAEPADHIQQVQAQFAPGLYVDTAHDDKLLGSQAFLPLRAGIELHPRPADGAEARPGELTWEEGLVARDIRMRGEGVAGPFADLVVLEALASMVGISDPGWWPAATEVVTVAPVTPAVAVSSWSMADGGFGAGSTFELDQAVEAMGRDLMVVEAWEL
jgi:hypothetical protein